MLNANLIAKNLAVPRTAHGAQDWLLHPTAKAVLFLKLAIYIRPMSKFEFCLPTPATNVPAAPDWFHEIKYDGYRLRLERDGARVRLITKGGYD